MALSAYGLSVLWERITGYVAGYCDTVLSSMPIATYDTAGSVIPDGTTITIDLDGTIHGSADVPIATDSSMGKSRPDGETVFISNGVLSVTDWTEAISNLQEAVGTNDVSALVSTVGKLESTVEELTEKVEELEGRIAALEGGDDTSAYYENGVLVTDWTYDGGAMTTDATYDNGTMSD